MHGRYSYVELNRINCIINLRIGKTTDHAKLYTKQYAPRATFLPD